MKKLVLSLVIVFITCSAMAGAPAASGEEDTSYTIDVMIARAEDFFMSLNKGRYDAAWRLLSEKSRQTIIHDVHKTYEKMGGDIQRSAIERDFEDGGVIFNNYWKAFMQRVDVLMVLDDSRWQAGVIEPGRADIIITYRNSKNPLKLRMVKEDDLWKVGLVETFWQSRSMDLLQAILKSI